MEIRLIKKKLEGVKNFQEFNPVEVWEMLESAMEHIELLEEDKTAAEREASLPCPHCGKLVDVVLRVTLKG